MNNTWPENFRNRIMPDPWDLPLSSASEAEATISHCVTPWLTTNTEEIPPKLSPVNPPDIFLLTTHSESSGQILWRDWLKLHHRDPEKLAKPLRQMWGLLYWQEHFASG